ncbi:TIGR03546 family protein [Hylemonella sp. W303a]|uniref:TIGR03546 family protein n=1 Tax=Hylemonella sp. W303a TaxID=3389873 RepID=UPI00396B3DE0
MFVLDFAHKVVKLLHSEERPMQIGLGFALGSVIALTPLSSPHNLLVLLLLCIINVSFSAGLLGMVLMSPLAYALDGMFDRLGHLLLVDLDGLTAFWTALFNAPFMVFTRLNNTVVLGSLVASLLLLVPIAWLVALAVRRYRDSWRAVILRSRFYRWFSMSRFFVWGSKAYNFLYGGGR